MGLHNLNHSVDKGQALAMAIRQIESSFGKGSVMQLGST
jgi:recombination protein RecA